MGTFGLMTSDGMSLSSVRSFAMVSCSMNLRIVSLSFFFFSVPLINQETLSSGARTVMSILDFAPLIIIQIKNWKMALQLSIRPYS